MVKNIELMLIKEKILFNREECLSIINLSKTDSKDWILNDRNYNSYLIKYSKHNKWIFDKLSGYFEQQTGLKIIKMKKEIHFHKFIKNDWFGRHNDSRENRIYAIGVCLNDDFKGGDFVLYLNKDIILDKTPGNTYIFDVLIDHEIKPILEGSRYSLLWFLDKSNLPKREITKII